MNNHKDLRVVYMGTPHFAVVPLKKLLELGVNVVAVVTAPDKPAGRGQSLSQSAVKQFAVSNNLNIFQPEKLKDEYFIDQLAQLKPDISIVVAFRMLPEIVWRIPRLGTFNLHASLLPSYRGAAPINWAIINGESVTGVTTFLIDEKIDTGNILLQHKVEILPNETAGELHDRLMPIGANLVAKTISLLASGQTKPTTQDELMADGNQARVAPKLFKDTTRIDWRKSSNHIHNFIRGLSPYPAAWCELINLQGVKTSVKIFRSQLTDCKEVSKEIGAVSTNRKDFIHIQCGSGVISIVELQIAGKRNLPVRDFLLGFRDVEEWRFV